MAEQTSTPPATSRGRNRPHVIYLAIGFPPAAKSSAYRLRETANQFCAAGWDVTAVTICDEAWEREYGLDHTLSADVDPRIRVVRLPLMRQDLETDIRKFSEARALAPPAWLARHRAAVQKAFPEQAFGAWRPALERAILRLHRRHPADLLMTSCAPYVNLAATWRLWEKHRVPYVVDFRDAWSLDVIEGGEAFSRDSVAGRWEARVLAQARQVWCVNDPIAEFYRQRYPEIADRVRVVRNGYDQASIPAQVTQPDPAAGLTFGYLGSVNFSLAFLESVLAAWRIARRRDPVLARSRFEVRGHFGAGARREANEHIEVVKEAEPHGVTFGGPVAKADLRQTYGRWDALVLMLTGGRYVTSGKVYEFMATGLPIMSVHEIDHNATRVLTDHPLWVPPVGLDPNRLAESFIQAAELAVRAPEADRARARSAARQYERAAQLATPIGRLSELIRPAEPVRSARTGSGG